MLNKRKFEHIININIAGHKQMKIKKNRSTYAVISSIEAAALRFFEYCLKRNGDLINRLSGRNFYSTMVIHPWVSGSTPSWMPFSLL